MKLYSLKRKVSVKGRFFIGDVLASLHYLTYFTVKSEDIFDVKMSTQGFLDGDNDLTVVLESPSFKKNQQYIEETRDIKHTPTILFIGSEKYDSLTDEEREFFVKDTLRTVKNPDYLPFPQYTRDILNDYLENPEDLKSCDEVKARKYYDAIIAYHNDKKYSNTEKVAHDAAFSDDHLILAFNELKDVKLTLFLNIDYSVVKLIMQICSAK